MNHNDRITSASQVNAENIVNLLNGPYSPCEFAIGMLEAAPGEFSVRITGSREEVEKALATMLATIRATC